MNAYEIYEAAFDAANDYSENNVQYILDYAENALDNPVSHEIAQKILDCRLNWLAHEDKCQSAFDATVKFELEEISAS